MDKDADPTAKGQAVAVARMGGLARAQRLTSEQRSEISRKAAAARWGTVQVAFHTGTMQSATSRSLRQYLRIRQGCSAKRLS